MYAFIGKESTKLLVFFLAWAEVSKYNIPAMAVNATIKPRVSDEPSTDGHDDVL